MNNKNIFIYPNRYLEYYQKIICQDIILKEPYSCFMELPKLDKLVIHTTSKYYVQDEKNIFPPFLGLEMVSGQKPKLNYAHKSISTFKLREKQLISSKVDLRNMNLYKFLDKLITIILPITRTSSGIKKQSFQKQTFSRAYESRFEGVNLFKQPLFFSVPPKEARKNDKNKKNKKTPSTLQSRVGAYHFGLQNLLIFPELETRYQLFEKDVGIDVSIIIKNSSSENNLLLLLTAFQFPLER